MSQEFGELLALSAALCGAVSSILYNKMGKRTGADLIAYVRMLIAVPLMCIYMFIADGTAVFHSDLRSVAFLAVSGIIGFFITDLFMFRAYVQWGARETMVVMCLAPVLSGIFSFFLFNESLSTRQLAGALCSIAGIVAMTAFDGKEGRKRLSRGASFAFLAAFLQSIADMFAKSALVDMPWVTSSAIRAVGGLLAWLVFAYVKRETLFEDDKPLKEKGFRWLLLFNVLVGTAVSTTLAMGALKYAPAGIVTSLKQVSPVFILPYEVLVEKKKLSGWAVAGTLVSVFGVFLLF